MSAAIVLLSGGLDSTTTLAIARERGFTCHALAFRYGQRHAVELRAAEHAASAHQATFRIVDVDLRAFGGSALTSDVAVPKGRDIHTMSTGVPITYVPARNTIFLSFALAACEVTGARHIFIGANALDYSGYPDCRPEFLRAFEAMANLATKAGVEGERISIEAPLLAMSKAQIVREGTRLGVDLGRTWSCYDPQGAAGAERACGACDSCLLRKKGFVEAGVPDPTPYA